MNNWVNVQAVAEKRIGEGSGRSERVESCGFYRLTSGTDFQMELPGRQIHESKGQERGPDYQYKFGREWLTVERITEFTKGDLTTFVDS